MHARDVLAMLALGAALPHPACATASGPERTQQGPRPGQTAFYNEGKEILFGADTRASRITGPDEFLPVQVVILNRSKIDLTVFRESFTLVRPDGVNLPAASPEEFWRDYHRARADVRMGQPFLENIFGRFPEQPFRWASLDLFPDKYRGGVPRDGLTLRLGDGTYGYVYFRHPGDKTKVPLGLYQLIFRPKGTDTTYVLDFLPYPAREKKP